MTLLSIAIILFMIMDPLGNVSSYLSLVKEVEPKRQRWVLTREMLIALLVMMIFNYIGEFIFQFLEVSETTVRLSSGVILFLIAIKILFPANNSLRANLPKGEPFLTPLAIPLIAGPSLLATIMLYAHLELSQPLMLGAILLAWAGTFVILISAPFFSRTLGDNGLMACEKLSGMVLVMIAIQRFMEGMQQFLSEHAHVLKLASHA